MDIHPQTFLDGMITEAHLNQVYAVTDKHAMAGEGALQVFSNIQKQVRNMIGHVLTSWFMQAARQVELIAATAIGGINAVTRRVVENPTRDNFMKLWFVMFGAFDCNQKLFPELEEVVMKKCRLQYKSEWVKLELNTAGTAGKDKHGEWYNDREYIKREYYGVGCIGQQIKTVLQNKQKNINRKLMGELGISITKSKPLLLAERNGVKKVVQQRRRVKCIFEPCFVRIKNVTVWERVCRENRIPPEETREYTLARKGKKVTHSERSPSFVTPWKTNDTGNLSMHQVSHHL